MSGSVERRYWKNAGELAAGGATEGRSDEFPVGAADAPDGMTRRTMLQLVGGSLSLAGLAACRRPVEYIVPYVNAPEEVIPGIPRQYATTMPFGTSALGVLVESHEARPTKIEGNELHPASRGAASAWAQAAVYGLYDPDRMRFPSRAGKPTAQLTWKDFLDYWKPLHAELAGAQGDGLALILEPFASPTEARLVAKLMQRFPRARVVAYAPLGGENVSAGVAAAAGNAVEPVYHLDRARVILSLDADLLLEDCDAVRHARGFAAGRRVAAPGGPMNRLYVVESVLTITGVAADNRLRLQSGRVAAFTAALAAELGMGPAPGPANDIDRRWIQAVAGDLKANRGRCAIIAGAHQPAAVHAAVACLNAGLGNVGTTVTYVNAPETMRSSTPALRQLADDMRAGAIKTVVVLGGNPVYDAPADVDLAAALAKVPNRIRLGDRVDETALACDWRLPEAHFLEAWGDARSVGGPLSVVQPLIAPLFGGKSVIELLAVLESGQEAPGYDLVRETWRPTLGADFEPAWKRVLHDGLLAGSEPPPISPLPIDMAPLAALAADPLTAAAPATAESLEIVFRPSATVYDGRFANNGWLQELPEPISKLTWDNAALLSAATAKALGVESGDVVRLALHEREIEAPVLVLPGSADGSLTLALGYGREAAGRIGTGVGCNAYRLRTSRPAGFDTGLALQRTGRRYPFSVTSDHWSMEGRVIVQEATVEEYRQHPDLAREHQASLPSLQPWQGRAYANSPQWGMTIDLNSCIGCNACVVACQAENNVPVVGKVEVARGREMQWIRVDRYFAGRADAPESIVFQPVPCQQCENAPCEQVCPVAATMHDSQGRNVMVYNRCIGTRYCSNNCPYKVRRFNFFNFTRDLPDTLQLAQNPNVTVRARGVMEKCTYCVQRANRAMIDAKLAGRQLADGDVRTACQQTCPTQAIQFGDIRDPGSTVAAHKASPRNYSLLAELNTRPRTTYLMRLRNPNPELQES